MGLTHSHAVVHPHALQLKVPPPVLYQRVDVLGICRKTVPRRIEHYERAESRAIQPSEPWCEGLIRVWPTRSRTVVHPHALQLKILPTVLYQRVSVLGICRKTVPQRIEHYERAESRAMQASEPWCAG